MGNVTPGVPIRRPWSDAPSIPPPKENTMKIKYPAVLVATLVHYILGGLWYSPVLFGNKFIQLINWTPEKLQQVQNESHVKELALAFVMSLILVYILAHFVQYT